MKFCSPKVEFIKYLIQLISILPIQNLFAQVGGIDLTFNPGTGANSLVETTIQQSDGKVIIGGNFTTYNGIARNYLARVNTDGSLDNSFNPGTGPNGGIYSTALQSDGKIIIGGSFTSYNGTTRNYIARINTDGSLDNTFNPGTGPGPIGQVWTISFQSDGKIILGGLFTSYNGTSRNYIARINSNGSLDNTFNPGTGANSSIETTCLQPDGKIIIGGVFTSYNGTARNYIARINADGSLDNTFNSGSGANSIVRRTALQGDGKVVVVGDFTSYNGSAINNLARINTNGSLDNSFNPGTGVNSFIWTTTLQPNGKIIIAGSFTSYNGNTRNRIARINADGSLDNTFNPGTGANSLIRASASNNNTIIITGDFLSYNGTSRNRIARIFTEPTVLTSDSLALVALYNATNGPGWTNKTNWLIGPVNTWFGVTVSANRVTQIVMCTVCSGNIQGNNLVGTIPPELGNLSNLTTLYLFRNQLIGTIPSELGNLSNLTRLELFNNQLTGSIPAELGNLSNLTDLKLYANQLAGPIPPELGNLSNLKILWLPGNQLTGSIPPELGNLSNLNELYLGSNPITGTIPPQLGNLSNLNILSLHFSQLTGTIPPQLGNLSNLTQLWLESNQLTGSIPLELGNLSNLRELLLFNNQLTGSIPHELGNLSNLTDIKLNTNQLTGPIPPELGNLINLELLDLNSNQLTGSIPFQLSNLINLRFLDLNSNQLTGSIPHQLSNLSNLQFLWLPFNQLTGSIPPELGNLSNLQSLWLDTNQLTGSIPPELGNLNNLIELLLFDNQLTGSIPPELDNLSNLDDLLLHNNQLTGMPDLGGLASVTSLWVQNNFLEFGDMESNMDISGFRYSPQGLILGGGNQSLTTGTPFTASFAVSGSANIYQWRKNGVTVSGATSNSFTIPSLSLSDAGTYVLFITNSLVPGLTLQTEPIVLTIIAAPQAAIEIKTEGTANPVGSSVQFSNTGVGTDQLKELEIANTGTAQLVITDIQITGDFNFIGSLPPPIDPGSSTFLSVRFAPTNLGERTGTLTIVSNGDVPVFTLNLVGEGDAEPEVYNIVTANQNGKHDFLNIRNITLFPNNMVSIFDRWGNKVFEKTNYDNATGTFSGRSDNGKDLPEGTYYYVIDKNNGSDRITGFLMLRR